jgi:hypothetical protein
MDICRWFYHPDIKVGTKKEGGAHCDTTKQSTWTTSYIMAAIYLKRQGHEIEFNFFYKNE